MLINLKIPEFGIECLEMLTKKLYIYYCECEKSMQFGFDKDGNLTDVLQGKRTYNFNNGKVWDERGELVDSKNASSMVRKAYALADAAYSALRAKKNKLGRAGRFLSEEEERTLSVLKEIIRTKKEYMRSFGLETKNNFETWFYERGYNGIRVDDYWRFCNGNKKVIANVNKEYIHAKIEIGQSYKAVIILRNKYEAVRGLLDIIDSVERLF